MAKIKLSIYVDDKTNKDLEDLMNLAIEDEDGVVRYRLYEGDVKQEFYRIILRAGINAKKLEFDKKKKELQNES